MGAIGSIVGGLASAWAGDRASRRAAEASNQGYNYLLGNETVQGTIGQAGFSTDAINEVLGLGGDGPFEDSLAYDRLIAGPDMSDRAFEQFRDSTGYNFRLDEGMRGVTGSAAARGLLNSGATARGLTQYAQGLASDEYSRFFNQQRQTQQDQQSGFLNYLTALQGQQQTGLNAAYNTASQGASAGAQAGQYIMQGAGEVASGLGVAVGGLSDYFANRSQSSARIS